MKKIPVVYWSASGNTEKMAQAISEGITASGGEAMLLNVAEANPGEIAAYNDIALGCPAMGDEVLEESEFAPFFLSLQSTLHNKNLVIFGSYGWGGSYMANWEADIKDAGGNLLAPGLLAMGEPDTETIADCKKLGELLVKA